MVSAIENTLVNEGINDADPAAKLPTKIRRMLADRLQVDESVLTDDFRWLAVIDPVEEEELLADVSATFTVVPPGLSLGSGHSPFHKAEPNALERIATVGELIAQIEQHLARYSDSRRV